VVAAFMMLAFLAAHLYFTLTTSEKPFAFVKAMITGYEENT
jgi:thiosulfate reductase cytochrome b subunit